MVRWSKGKPPVPTKDDAAEKIGRGALEATSKLGDLMQRHPSAICDTTMLPLPKPAMKLALKRAWLLAKDEKTRRAVGVAYVGLADFQDGVGDKPIASMPPDLMPSASR